MYAALALHSFVWLLCQEDQWLSPKQLKQPSSGPSRNTASFILFLPSSCSISETPTWFWWSIRHGTAGLDDLYDPFQLQGLGCCGLTVETSQLLWKKVSFRIHCVTSFRKSQYKLFKAKFPQSNTIWETRKKDHWFNPAQNPNKDQLRADRSIVGWMMPNTQIFRVI